MKKLRIYSLLLMIFSLQISYAQTEDFYGTTLDTFSYFQDPNTGLTIFPTLLVPLGGNLQGMGTAYTAVSSDSGYIEANPAGSALLSYGELSLLHNNWIDDSSIEGLIYTFRMNNLGLGFSGKFLYLPFTATNNWGEAQSKGYISESIATANISYRLFSNYYFDGLALGMNIKAAYRSIPENIYPGQSAITAMADFGLLTRFNLFKFFSSKSKNFSIGAAFKNLGFPALGEPLPTMFSGGISYSMIRPITLAIDYNLPVSLDPENFPAERWYMAAGLNIFFTNFLSMQTGFMVKENPRFNMGWTLDLSDIKLIGNYNLDLSGSLSPVDKFSIEAKIKLGFKEEMEKSEKISSLMAQGLEAYTKGEYAQAIYYWEKILEIDPNFTPAIEYIETTRKSMDLQQQMEKIQTELE
ncbi:MAG: UPF0164 family protein [Spirochaetales bacterium]|nr:UPF0164 family protein [Spirochaetales bacterium]